jgi:hypothetical protein
MATYSCFGWASVARRASRWACPAALVALAAWAVACGGDNVEVNAFSPIGTDGATQGSGGVSGSGGASGSAGSGGGGGNAGSPDCFMNPKTHYEIINACTNAVRVKKTPNLKGLNADGSLPPPP